MRLEARTRARAAGCGAGLALAAFVAAPPADAATDRASVAIVFADGIDEQQGVVHDLALELRAEGFRVHSIRKELDGEALDDLADRARDDGDGALLHVVPGAAGDVSIEVLAVTPNRLILKDTIRRQAGDTSDIASVRAVEVTRAALIPVKKPIPPADPTDIVRDDPYAAAAPSRSPFLSVSVAPVLAIDSSFNLPDVGMNLGWLPVEYVAVEIQGAIPLALTRTGPGTYLKETFVDVGGSLFFAHAQSWFRPYLALRGGAVVYTMGIDYPPVAVGASSTRVSYFGTVAAGASVEFHGHLRLRAEAGIGATVSPIDYPIYLAGSDRLGALIALFRAGPELLW